MPSYAYLALNFSGLDNLESFMNTCDSVLSTMMNPPSQDIVEVLFLEQLRHCSILREEIAHYDRAAKGSSTRTHQFLVESVKRYLERARHARNRKAMERALSGAAPAAAAASSSRPPQGKGSGKPRSSSPRKGSKGSGKGRNP